MITPEGIKLLNSILYELPINETFSVSVYTEKKTIAYDKEITDFLLNNSFANFVQVNILIRGDEQRRIELNDNGISLKDAGSYEAYKYNEIIRIAEIENSVRIQGS